MKQQLLRWCVRLYQSWGLVMLGCGCCLTLICVILCIHVACVMRSRQRRLADKTVSRICQNAALLAYMQASTQYYSIYIIE